MLLEKLAEKKYKGLTLGEGLADVTIPLGGPIITTTKAKKGRGVETALKTLGATAIGANIGTIPTMILLGKYRHDPLVGMAHAPGAALGGLIGHHLVKKHLHKVKALEKN